MSEQRSEEDVLRGVLLVSLGVPAVSKEIPILSIADARKWKAKLGQTLGGELGKMSLENLKDGGPIALAVGDRTVDLVLAYDMSAALGGREWIESNATDAQIYNVLRRLIEVSFPFVRDLKTLVSELRAIGLADLLGSATSLSGSSTKTLSPDGASVPLVSNES